MTATTPGAAIAALSDPDAIRVLAAVADYQARLPDPAELAVLDTGLREALTDGTGLGGYGEPGGLDQEAGSGDLARAALQHLAGTQPGLIPVITGAIGSPGPVLREPVTLAAGVLVILALQTEVKLSRDSRGRWAFTVHKHPARESTLGQVISKLLAAYLPGRR
jgi:hypothetical protein